MCRGFSFFGLPVRAVGAKIDCIKIQCQPGGLRVSNVTCDQDDQVIDQRGSSRMGELHKVLAALLDYIGPDVCDQVVSEGIEKAASIAAEMINNPAR